ncbi:MAG: hypothetical protein AB1938_09320 [Myxococcota bacterium]
MNRARTLPYLTLSLLLALGGGCNCGAPPGAEDGGLGGGAGGGTMDAGGGSGGGGGGGGGGGSVGGGPGPDVIEFSSASGRVTSTGGLTADVQLGVVPASRRAAGGPFVLEGSAVLSP